jgi:hypothetical protein
MDATREDEPMKIHGDLASYTDQKPVIQISEVVVGNQ